MNTIYCGKAFPKSLMSCLSSYFNTIISGSSKGGNCYDFRDTDWRSTLDTQTNNFFSDNTCDGHSDGDPKLGPLQDNGGPTKTHALLPGSPAINAGNNVVCTIVDQRDFKRTDGVCDIGAYEVGASSSVGPILTSINPNMSGLNDIQSFTLSNYSGTT